MFYPIPIEDTGDLNLTTLKKLDYLQRRVLNLGKADPSISSSQLGSYISKTTKDDDWER